MTSIRSIENKASKIRSLVKDDSYSVNVFKISEKLGVRVIEHDLGDNVSGVLYIEKGTGIIGYNSTHSLVRKRFTIAHELGHYILHKSSKELFVSQKSSKVIYFRDDKSTTGEDKEEREANAFAAALLMPRELLMKKLEETSFDFGNEEDVIKQLADKFEVSTLAMTYRIANLNLF